MSINTYLFHLREQPPVLIRTPEDFVEPLVKTTDKKVPRKLVPTPFGLVPVSDSNEVDPDDDLSDYEKSIRDKGKGKVVEDTVGEQR